jgi:guanine deaminase
MSSRVPAPGQATAIRGATLTFAADPFETGAAAAMRFESDAVIVMAEGRITEHGPAAAILKTLPAGTPITHYEHAIIMPGFLDAHVHYAQTPIVGAWGEHLLAWLERYAFPAELALTDMDHARSVARVYLEENLRNGITTAAVYGTVFPASVDVLFEESERRGLRMIAGKVLMDRNAPAALLDTPQRGYDESKALIARWHGHARSLYAITPRFAATSSPEQLELAGALRREHPDVFVQTHVSEQMGEIAWVKELFPSRASYADVYDHFGLLGPRVILGHGVHLTEPELALLHRTGTAIAHCATSNLFLGSGLFDLRRARSAPRPVHVAIGTDIGAGTTFSILQTLNETYKVAHVQGYALGPAHAFYLATRGSARALGMDGMIGSIAPGMEADLVVLDLHATPLLRYRTAQAKDELEALFLLMTLGDDRAVRATWAGGQLAHDRDEGSVTTR